MCRCLETIFFFFIIPNDAMHLCDVCFFNQVIICCNWIIERLKTVCLSLVEVSLGGTCSFLCAYSPSFSFSVICKLLSKWWQMLLMKWVWGYMFFCFWFFFLFKLASIPYQFYNQVLYQVTSYKAIKFKLVP